MTRIDPRHWRYKSEGNANVVFEYFGKEPAFRHTVIRIAKNNTGQRTDAVNLARFQQQFITTLFGTSYSPELTPIRVDRSVLATLDIALAAANRPTSRRHDTINLDTHYVILIPDYSAYPLAFELKPKWGAKPPASAGSVKSTVCRFCMYQVARQVRNPEHVISRYCPLDLFSDNHDRMRKAVTALIAVPQNNLRMYKDGVQQSPRLITKQHADILVQILESDPFLLTLKQAQQRLDPYDISGINDLYKRYESEQGKLAQPTVDNLMTTARRCTSPSRSLPLSEIPTDNIPAIIQQFLLSATLRDVSIFIFVRPVTLHSATDDLAQQHIIIDGQIYKYRMKVIDADIKPIERVPSYWQKDSDIVDDFLRAQVIRECH